MKRIHKQIVIGLGTGRCGTKTLSYLLNHQPWFHIRHECTPILPYEQDYQKLENKLQYIGDRCRRNKVYGDVSFYYLWYAEYLLFQYDDLKILCVERNNEDVVNSYYKKVTKKVPHSTEPLYKNFWQDDNGRYKSDWDKAYPKFSRKYILREAIEKYCEFYKKWCREIVEKYSDRFFIFDVEVMNSITGQDKIYEFLCIPKDDRKYFQVKVRDRWGEVRNKELEIKR